MSKPDGNNNNNKGSRDYDFHEKNTQLLRDCIPCGCVSCHYYHHTQTCPPNSSCSSKEGGGGAVINCKDQYQKEPEFLFTGKKHRRHDGVYVEVGVGGYGLTKTRPPPLYYDPHYYGDDYFRNPHYHPEKHLYPLIPRSHFAKRRPWMRYPHHSTTTTSSHLGGNFAGWGYEGNGQGHLVLTTLEREELIEECAKLDYRSQKQEWVPERLGLLDYTQSGLLGLGSNYRTGKRVPEYSHVCVKSKDRMDILYMFSPHFQYLFYQRNRALTVESANADYGMAISEKHHKALMSVYKTLGIQGAGNYEPKVIFKKIIDRVMYDKWILVAPQTNVRYLEMARSSRYDVLGHWTSMLAVETTEMMNKHYEYIPTPYHETYVPNARLARKLPPSMALQSDRNFFWTILAQSALMGFSDGELDPRYQRLHQRLEMQQTEEIEQVQENIRIAASSCCSSSSSSSLEPSSIGGNFGRLFYSERKETIRVEETAELVPGIEYGGPLDNVQPLFHRHELLIQVADNMHLYEARSPHQGKGSFFTMHRIDKKSKYVSAAMAKVAFDAWGWGTHSYISDRKMGTEDFLTGFETVGPTEAMVLYDHKFVEVYKESIQHPWYYAHHKEITGDEEHVSLFGNLHAKNSIELAMLAKMANYEFVHSLFFKWKASEHIRELFEHDSLVVRHYTIKIVKILTSTTIRFLKRKGIHIVKESMTSKSSSLVFSTSTESVEIALREISELRMAHLVKLSMIKTSWSSYGPAEVRIMLLWLSYSKNMVMPVYYLNAMLQSLSRSEIEMDKEKGVPLYEIL